MGIAGCEVPGDAAEQQRVGDPVGDGIEERAPGGHLPGAAGDGAVEQVAEAAHGDPDDAEHEVPRADEDRGRGRRDEPEGRQRVGGHPDPPQPLTKGLQALSTPARQCRSSIWRHIPSAAGALRGTPDALASASNATTGPPASGHLGLITPSPRP